MDANKKMKLALESIRGLAMTHGFFVITTEKGSNKFQTDVKMSQEEMTKMFSLLIAGNKDILKAVRDAMDTYHQAVELMEANVSKAT